MKILSRCREFFLRWFKKKSTLPAAAVKVSTDLAATRPPLKMRISEVGLMGAGPSDIAEAFNPFKIPPLIPGVMNDEQKLACDEGIQDFYRWAGQSTFSEGLQFLGYPYLAELSQRAEYRKPVEILAKKMTAKWIKLQSTGDQENDKSDKLKIIEAELKRLNVQDCFRRLKELDGFFGRGQIYIDTGSTDYPAELKLPLIESTAKVKRNGLRKLVVIEPIWTYPNMYNSVNPLQEDFFKPHTWFVMGQQLHSSRLLTLVSREVPDILKPAYSFGGLALTQIMKPYIDNWLRTRQSVSDLVSNFSTMVLKTDMSSLMNMGAGVDFYNRLELFNRVRNNRGLMAVSKDAEELENISVPLSGLEGLQAQSQEQMSSVAGIPLIILLGITPTGLNAMADGELQAFDDAISEAQMVEFDPLLTKIINLIQLSKFGEIDKEIGYKWEPLRSLDEVERSTVEKNKMETHTGYVAAAVIDPIEVRKSIAADPDSPYASLDVNAVPTPPPQEEESPAPGEEPGMEQFGGGPEKTAPAQQAADMAMDFNEADIERVPAGQSGGGEFASKGGSGGTPSSESKSGHLQSIEREKWPEHIKALGLPPAWKNVIVSPDPNADLQAIGVDQQGRKQYVYSEKFVDSQAAMKHARVKAMTEEMPSIMQQVMAAQSSRDTRVKALGDLTDLVMKMGIRPGSTADTKAKKQAYGATTLEGRHVVSGPDGVHLVFTGKSGKDLDLPVTDAVLAKMLVARAKAAGPKNRLFGNVSEKDLLNFSHSLGSGRFKTKDFRTLLGTDIALKTIAMMPAPQNMEQYRRAVNAIGDAVSEKLGNTRAIALQSYINPMVFSDWRAQAEKGGAGKINPEGMQSMLSRVAEKDGGFTYQPLSDREPKGGYAVSIYPDRSFAKDVNALQFADLKRYVRANKDLLSQPDHFIGAWHDPETDKVYLDISIVSDDEKKAADLASRHDQIAYFDLGKGASVTVNRSATSGGAAHG